MSFFFGFKLFVPYSDTLFPILNNTAVDPWSCVCLISPCCLGEHLFVSTTVNPWSCVCLIGPCFLGKHLFVSTILLIQVILFTTYLSLSSCGSTNYECSDFLIAWWEYIGTRIRILGDHNPNYSFCLREPSISFMTHDLPSIIEPLTPVTYCFFETKYNFLWNSIYTPLGRYNGNPHLYLELFVSYTNILFLLF